VRQARTKRYGLTAGTRGQHSLEGRACLSSVEGWRPGLSPDLAKIGQEPESGFKAVMLSGRTIYVIAPLHLGGCIRYFSTVDLVTSMPTFRSSPTIRGAPHVGFACHMSRISWRTSLGMAGRPGLPCWLSCRQWSRKRWCCQVMTVRG